MGALDPASILWERLPWSFVVDWWLPIGNYLEARAVANSLKGVFVTSRKWVYKWGKPVAIGGWYIRAPNYYREEGSFTRTVDSELVALKPTMKSFGEGLSWAHAQNAVALVIAGAPRVKKGLSSAWKNRHIETE